MRISGRYALTAAILLLALFSVTPVRAEPSWIVQAVDVNGYGGNGYCPIILDSGSAPLIAYTGVEFRYNEGRLKYDSIPLAMYARWNDYGWSTQEIAIGYATDIALDAHNTPHILYETGPARAGGLMYAVWTGLNWTIQTVDTSHTVYAALALDSAGTPHAAYSTGTTLKYASCSGSTWTIEAVDNGAEISFHLSLALDSNDKPYILYSNQGLKLATLEKSGWNIETVSLPDPTGSVGNMVLDSKNHPNLIYRVGLPSNATMKYARWTGVSWKTQTVVSGIPLESVIVNPFLALDSFDYPHICYVSGLELMYAVWTGVAWNIQTAAPEDGQPPYLAVDSNRIPHISYCSGTGPPASVMYAVASEPVPLASPLLIALPLLSLVTAVAVISAAIIAYLWRKK